MDRKSSPLSSPPASPQLPQTRTLTPSGSATSAQSSKRSREPSPDQDLESEAPVGKRKKVNRDKPEGAAKSAYRTSASSGLSVPATDDQFLLKPDANSARPKSKQNPSRRRRTFAGDNSKSIEELGGVKDDKGKGGKGKGQEL